MRKWMQWFTRLFTKAKGQKQGNTELENKEHNQVLPHPGLACMDSVLNQVLAARGYAAEQMRLAVIDAQDIKNTASNAVPHIKQVQRVVYEKQCQGQEPVFFILHQLQNELNGLTIYTDRPEAFEGYVQYLEEDQGLMVWVREKSRLSVMEENVVLDMEWQGPLYAHLNVAEMLYIPMFKKAWKVGENLDITVPIGYNTVIVKKSKNII